MPSTRDPTSTSFPGLVARATTMSLRPSPFKSRMLKPLGWAPTEYPTILRPDPVLPPSGVLAVPLSWQPLSAAMHATVPPRKIRRFAMLNPPKQVSVSVE